MAYKVPVTAGGDYERPAPGMYAAVCTKLIDMGYQETSWGPKEKVRLEFEFGEMKDGKPFVVGTEYTLSLSPKAILRKHLDSWLSKPKFEADFDLETLVAKPAMVQIVENQVGDKTYTNIETITPLPAGMAAPAPKGDVGCYTRSMPNAIDTLREVVPEWLFNRAVLGWDRAKSADAFPGPVATPTPSPQPMPADIRDHLNDDIPFG